MNVTADQNMPKPVNYDPCATVMTADFQAHVDAFLDLITKTQRPLRLVDDTHGEFIVVPFALYQTLKASAARPNAPTS